MSLQQYDAVRNFMSACTANYRLWVWVIPLWLCLASSSGAQSLANTTNEVISDLSVIEREYGQKDLRLFPVLNSLAKHYEEQDELKKALKVSLRALGIVERAHGKHDSDIATSLLRVGRLYYLLGERRIAATYFEKCLALHETHDVLEESLVTRYKGDMANIYLDLQDYEKALPHLVQTLALKERNLGLEHQDLAGTLDQLVTLHVALGDYPKALDFAKRSLRIRVKNLGSDHVEVAISIAKIGMVIANMGDVAMGAAMVKGAAAYASSKLGQLPDELIVNLLVQDALTSDDESRAIPLLHESMQLTEEKLGADDSSLASIAIRLAYLYAEKEQYDKALPLAYRALRIAVNDPQFDRDEFRVLSWGLADVERRAGNPELAIFYGKMVVNLFQGQREKLTSIPQELQRTFIEKYAGAYRWLIDLLIEQERLPEAQQVLAMLKEEEYFDFIRRDGQSDPRSSKTTATPKEQRWRLRLASAGEKLSKLEVESAVLTKKAQLGETVNSLRLAEIEREIQALQIAFHDTLRTIQDGTGESDRSVLGGVPASGPVEQSAVQETLRNLGHGAVLLQYVVTDSGVRIILTGPKTLIARESKIRKSDLKNKVALFTGWTLTDPKRDPKPLAKELYEILIAPVAEDLRKLDARTIMLSLDDALRYIPFAALNDGSRFLIEQYRLAMYTEVAKDKIRLRPTSDWQVAGLGLTRQIGEFKPLPSVRQELDGIVRTSNSVEERRGVLPGEIYLDQKFTEDRLRKVLNPSFQVLHIASHFKFQPGAESESFLLLGDGQHLSLAALRQNSWNFNSLDLVSLSACDTGKGGGHDGDGREIEGLGVLVQRQGAKGVIATLWSVSDQSTAILMQNFYRLRQAQHLTKAEALRQAQLAMISGSYAWTGAGSGPVSPLAAGKYTHPFYWAPFILMGNWL